MTQNRFPDIVIYEILDIREPISSRPIKWGVI